MVVVVGVDFFVICGIMVLVEYVLSVVEFFNFKKFIYDFDVFVIVGGVVIYIVVFYLMCMGVVGVFVGFGGGVVLMIWVMFGIYVLMVIVVFDVVVVCCDYFDEFGGCYVYVIVDGGVGMFGDIVKVFVMGVDVVMFGVVFVCVIDVLGCGFYWGFEVYYLKFLCGYCVEVGGIGMFEEILYGLVFVVDGMVNFIGVLCKLMVIIGYFDFKEF